MKRVLSLQIDAEIENREIDDERSRELRDRWKAADLTLRKAADIASLLVSEEAEKCLKGFIYELENVRQTNNFYYESIDKQYGVVDRRLTAIVKLADLDVKRRVWWRLA
jgi:hypothetical protein